MRATCIKRGGEKQGRLRKNLRRSDYIKTCVDAVFGTFRGALKKRDRCPSG